MPPKGKATAKARAAAQRVRDEQLQRANARQKLRRQAVQELNKLTVEIQVAAKPLCLNSDAGSLVEKRVRLEKQRNECCMHASGPRLAPQGSSEARRPPQVAITIDHIA